MTSRGAQRRAYPRLPVLGFASYAGPRAAAVPGVMDAPHRRHVISGRAAIAAALRLLGIGSGAKVLVPTYHCPTMISPVARAGAAPVFFPVTGEGSPDLAWLERADLTGVRALLAVHYFGIPQPMGPLRAFCDRRGIALIEDCAHAFFGSAGERPMGSWGDYAVASLTKFFPVPEGGLLVSAGQDLDRLRPAPRRWREQLKAAANAVEMGALYGRFPGLNALLAGAFRMMSGPRCDPGTAGREPGAADARTAADSLADPLLAVSELTLAARWIADTVSPGRIIERRRRNYAELARHWAGIAGARLLCRGLDEGVVPYVVPLYVDHPEASYQKLRSAGVPISRWDVPWPGTPRLDGDCGLEWSHHVFQMGCHQDLSPADIAAIAATTRRLIEER